MQNMHTKIPPYACVYLPKYTHAIYISALTHGDPLQLIHNARVPKT